jgi:hypothetical protein
VCCNCENSLILSTNGTTSYFVLPSEMVAESAGDDHTKRDVIRNSSLTTLYDQ